MDDWTTQLFAREIANQCQLAQLAAVQLSEALALLKLPLQDAQTFGQEWEEAREHRDETGDFGSYLARMREIESERPVRESTQVTMNRVWLALQGILVSAANISKLLWGSKDDDPQVEARRKPLRDALKVSDSSPLRSKRLRNDFEHFDDRLERWGKRNTSGIFISRNIDASPNDAPFIGGAPTNRMFGHYNTTTGTVTFWTHKVSLHAILGEIDQLLPLAEQEAKP